MQLKFPDHYKKDSNVTALIAALKLQGYRVLPYTNEVFCLIRGKRKKLVLLQTIFLNGFHVPYITIYKHGTKRLLNKIGITTPKGWLVSTERECVRRAKQLRYHCVIKPNSSSLGIGVNVCPQDSSVVRRAYRFARRSDQEQLVIVERYVPGKDLRILTLHGKFLSAMHREPANVVGDGRQTIHQLIVQKNRLHQRRHLPPIQLSAVRRCLPKLQLNTVPKQREIVFVMTSNNICLGGEGYGISRQVHQSYKQICAQICQTLNMNCIGFDWHVQDWTKPYNKKTDYIIELNSSPDVFSHHWLWGGTTDPVVKKIATAIAQS